MIIEVNHLDEIMAGFPRSSYTVRESEMNLDVCLTLLIPTTTLRSISVVIVSRDGSAIGWLV